MTQERVSGNNSFPFVMEDPSKPRRQQLNFQSLDQPMHIQPTMDQNLASHHPHNPQHHSLHHVDHHPPSRQITLPSIKELMQIPPSPIPQPQPPPTSLQQQQRILQQQQQQQQQYLQHHHHHNNIHLQHKTDSLISTSRPHLPPLQPSLETHQNPTNINYPFNATSRNDNNRIDSHLPISQHSQQQHSSHPLHQPLMPPSSSENPSYYSSHSSYPSHSTNSHYSVNHKISQIPPPQYSQGAQHTHYQQPPLPPHQQQRSPQVLPHQMQSSQRISHHHHHHHHPPPPPPSHSHHLQPQHQVQQLPQQQVPQGYHPSHHPHVYNNEVGIERSQHDHQSSATSVAATRVPYNSHHYHPQVYSNNSVPPILSSASSHVTSSHGRPLTDYPPVRDATSSGPLLSNDQHFHQQHGISGHIQQYPPPPPPQHLQQYSQAQQQQQPPPPQQPMYMQHHHQQQQQQQQQQQPQPQSQSQPLPQPQHQVSHLQVPPQNIPRPLTPPQLTAPQLNLPLQHPQQIQNQFLPDNREPSPSHLVPPSHHHSGSNSSVSTRSSSPAPSTPVAPFSPNGVPNNMDKPVEQNVSDKKRGRSKHRRIIPAGPIPNQQPAPSSQSIPQNTQNDSLVFVPYSNSPTNNTLPPKPPQVSRSRKNSISGSSAPSTSKRGRKAKDSSQAKAEVNNVVNNTSSVSIPMSENNEKSRKREHSWLSSSVDNKNNKRYKKGEEVHVIQDDDVVMDDDVIHNEREVEESKINSMDIDDNDVNLLLSLKENNFDGTTPLVNGVAENTVTVNASTVDKPVVEPVINNEDIKIKEEHFVNKNVLPVVESKPVVNNINNNIEIKSEKISGEDLFDQSVTTRVRELSLTPEEKPLPYTQEKKVTPRSPKKSNDIVKSENTRVITNKVQDKKERTKIAPAGNDSDSDLAMDDGSEDEVDKNKQPEQNFSMDSNIQWNSDDMETEEEVEEEIEISGIGTSSAAREDENKQNTVDSFSSPTNVINKQKINENVKETKVIVSTNPSSKKLSTSPISSCFTTTNNGSLSRKASTSSSISRKGSTSSNGSNKEKDNVVYSSPIEAPIASPIASSSSPPSAKAAPADAGNSNTAITNGNISHTRSQRPCPPRRRSTMRDDEKLELNAIEWEKNIEIPHNIWEETLRVFEIVKHSKEMKNRQPHRKRNHILASILFILCRQNGLPRTFVEICNAASIRKQEIGTYYRLMLKVFESNGLGGGSNGTVDSAEYLKRWCQNLKLPSHILDAAIHVYRQASELNITTGKCPVSVGAASIWLSINSWNEIRMSNYSHTHPDDAELIKVEHKDVAAVAGVVNATLVGCFKNLLKYKDKLLPEGFLKEARDRSPYFLKINSTDNINNSNPESDTYGQLSSSLDNVKHYGSPTADNCDNIKSTGEIATIKIEPTLKPIKSEPVLKSPTKSQVKFERSEMNYQPLKSIKEVDITTKIDPVIKKEIKHERVSQVLKSPPITKPIPEVEPGQEDADDELEEGELREDDDDMMD